MRPSLRVSTYHLDDAVVLRLVGHLAGDTLAALRATASQLDPVLDRSLHTRRTVLVLDLTQLSGCDRSGLAILSAVGDAAVQAGVEPRLAAAPRSLRDEWRDSPM